MKDIWASVVNFWFPDLFQVQFSDLIEIYNICSFWVMPLNYVQILFSLASKH
jgi:hypothetical protein